MGPAIQDRKILCSIIEAGVDIIRLNLSHGDLASHAVSIAEIRQVEKLLNRDIPILMDTKGPEIRIGTFQRGLIILKAGDMFTLTTRQVRGKQDIVSVLFPDFPKVVSKGQKLLLNDGAIELKVIETGEQDVSCQVIIGGELSDRKKINIPGVNIAMPFLSAEDRVHLAFCAREKVDFIACSFVRNAQDIKDVKDYLQVQNAPEIQIIAKIENRAAVENIDEIIQIADGIMIARGDLGVEIPVEEVPLLQKMIIKKCNLAGKPVITATQMLESMTFNPRPTRAEASDVANAIIDGTDAVMLSGETASGKYPLAAVEIMHKIVVKTEEASIAAAQSGIGGEQTTAITVTDAISYATNMVAKCLGVKAIIAPTRSGYTARMIAKNRPAVPIIAAVADQTVFRRLQLVRGVVPLLVEVYNNTDEMIEAVKQAVTKAGYVHNGDLVVITAGVLAGETKTTNLLRVERM